MQLLGLGLEAGHALQVVKQALRRSQHLSHAVLQLPTEHDLGHHLRRAVMSVIWAGAGVGGRVRGEFLATTPALVVAKL